MAGCPSGSTQSWDGMDADWSRTTRSSIASTGDESPRCGCSSGHHRAASHSSRRPVKVGRRPGLLVWLPGRRHTGPMPQPPGWSIGWSRDWEDTYQDLRVVAAERDLMTDEVDGLATAAYLTGRDE